MAEEQEKINNGNGAKITLRDVDVRLRKVEQRLAEQHGYQRTLAIALQASVAVNVALLGFLIGKVFG
jgi:hypothetical protein